MGVLGRATTEEGREELQQTTIITNKSNTTTTIKALHLVLRLSYSTVGMLLYGFRNDVQHTRRNGMRNEE